MIHHDRNPVVIQCGSESAAQSIIHRAHRIRVPGQIDSGPSRLPSFLLTFGSESAAQSSRHRIRTRVGSAVYRPLNLNPVDIEFGSPAHWQPESMIHRNPVVIQFGSESAAKSIIHRKTALIDRARSPPNLNLSPSQSRHGHCRH